MFLLFAIGQLALAAPWTVQIPAGAALSDGAPADPDLRAWWTGPDVLAAAPVFPPSAKRADPEAFRALGLHRFWRLELAAGAEPPAGWLAHATPDGTGSAHAAPGDTWYDWQWGLDNDGAIYRGAVAGADIAAEAAWDLETGAGVVIAILDSGIPVDEPDLSVWTNPGEVAGDGIDNDGNGYVDDALGWDFAYGDADPSDVGGHGSNVAGIAAATGDNGLGYSGVCWGCAVMGCKNLYDEGYGYYSDWAESVVYAVDNGAGVINMSEGGYGYDLLLDLSIRYAHVNDVPVIVSMGNDDSDRWVSFPSDLPEAIAVGATDVADQRASPFTWGGGSSYGDHISVIAPGDEIYSLGPTAGNYDWYWSGTSQAAPFVAGLAGLLLSAEPGLSAEAVRGYIESGAVDEVGDPSEDTPGWDRYYGHGRIDAAASLSLLLADTADSDGDGVDRMGGDCDDEDGDRWPGAPELCDGLDNDCDGEVPSDETDIDDDGALACAGDCDDADASVYPSAAEIPDDGVDQDCSGADAVTCWIDADGDGVGGDATAIGEDGDCDDPWESHETGDCDDADAEYAADCPVATTGDTGVEGEPGGCGCSGAGGVGWWVLGLVAVWGRGDRW